MEKVLYIDDYDIARLQTALNTHMIHCGFSHVMQNLYDKLTEAEKRKFTIFDKFKKYLTIHDLIGFIKPIDIANCFSLHGRFIDFCRKEHTPIKGKIGCDACALEWLKSEAKDNYVETIH